DPRIAGPGTNLQYTYVDNSGFASQELDGVTGTPMLTLTVNGDDFTVTYGNGSQRVLNYHNDLFLNYKIDGLNRQTSFQYDSNGFMKQRTDALGRVTRYKKTIYDNPLLVVYPDPDGSRESWTRDDLDLVLAHTDELGKRTVYTRDPSTHRVTRI